MRNIKKTLLTLVALLLAFAMCFSIAGCDKDDDKSDKGPKYTPEELVQLGMKYLLEDNDAKAYTSLMHEKLLEDMAKQKDMTVDEYISSKQEELDNAYVQLEEIGAEISITYEVSEAKDCDRAEEITEQYKERYNLDVEDVKEVDTVATAVVKFMGQEETNPNENTIIVCKIDGEWYIHTDLEDA